MHTYSNGGLNAAAFGQAGSYVPVRQSAFSPSPRIWRCVEVETSIPFYVGITMNTSDLVPVFSGEIDGKSAQLVDARTLHSFLENADEFVHWFKDRVHQYGFEEGVDFLGIFPKNQGRGRPRTDYHVTLDTAKELAMVERNEKGRQIRRYFIECERRMHGAIAYDATATSAHTAPPPAPEMSAALQAALCREAYQIASESYDGILAELTERARHYLSTGIPEADILDCLKRKGFGRASMVHPKDLAPLLDQAKAMFNSLHDLVEGGSELYAMRMR